MKLLVSALEASSNLHLKELLKHTGDIEIIGIFDKTIPYGTPIYDISEMAIMGFVDAIKKIRWFYRVADEMVALAKDADKILLMDSSGFNLPLAKKLKTTYPNKEIIYYILPQVWASRVGRVKKLELYCDRLLGILPFEVAYYPQKKVQYVGHPLLDEITTRTKSAQSTVAFMPGSRRSEIAKLLPIFKSLRQKMPDKKAILIIPASFSEEKIASLYGDISIFELSRNTHTSLAQSEFAFICSGTATLEAALIGTPFVLAYIAKSIDYFIAKHIFGLRQIGLSNIILTHHNGTTLHREIIQNEVTVENLFDVFQTTDRTLFAKKSEELRHYLGHGSSENVAKIIGKKEQKNKE